MIFFYGYCCGLASFGIAVALIELVRWLDRKEEFYADSVNKDT